ncbi:MAG: Trm112 family protein [Candidatus Muirbacterium halophilum]|nr:Trm112 family protein [Candidatus Muirbacterium halophilum]MCK9475259.1 Trm112 family protein [Candidatus Muirbacterium halophilum]
MVKKELLDILACPICKGDIEEYKKNNDEFLLCRKCNKMYAVRDDIPVMLIDEAIEFKG